MSEHTTENTHVGNRTVPFEVFDSSHPDHVHRCASEGYPAHHPSAICICAGCGERFDGLSTPPERSTDG